MKLYAVTLSLILALPFAAQAQTAQSPVKESRVWMDGHSVIVRTETSTQAPAVCQSAFDRQVDQQGWHDEIYRAVEGDKAVVILSQRDADACRVKEVKITLWKAAAQKGKTVTETWVYNLKPAEVNRFLDNELPQIAVKFATSPVSS